MRVLTTVLLALPCLASASALNGLPESTTEPGDVATSQPLRTNDTDSPSSSPAPPRSDTRPGPKKLPKKLPIRLHLGSFVASYSRLGASRNLHEFLSERTGPYGCYIPPQSGFQLDFHGSGINGSLQLGVGTLIDRFGSEYGQYVSAASAPFSQRSLPPSNLDTDPNNPDFPYGYHLYQVIRPFTVIGGPIAPWFGQPGLGAQFYTGETGNIMKLIADGYIQREDPSVLVSRSHTACT